MHTPGPWAVFNNHNSFWQIQSPVVGKGYYATIGSFCQRDRHPTHGGAITSETARANALLASKAPEMLALLQRTVGMIVTADPEGRELLADVKALLERLK